MVVGKKKGKKGRERGKKGRGKGGEKKGKSRSNVKVLSIVVKEVNKLRYH